jgi:hypothetical protein
MTGRWIERCVALAAALVVPMSLRFMSLPNVLALCDQWPVVAPHRATPRALAARVYRWMAFGRGPWKSSCLTRSLVLYAMLRQHGYRPSFHVGVSGLEKRFDAHAWVTVAGVSVSDAQDVTASYTPLHAHRA